MFLLFVCLGLLAVGYLVYGRFVEGILLPYREPTPAYTLADGVDYVPMSRAKTHLIQLLNIAGTGPIFGALMGAKWGPVVLVWIVAGTIFGGAVHDYMCGMMSERNKGKSATYLIRLFMGEKWRYPILLLVLFAMLMVTATFTRSASDLLTAITGIPSLAWVVLILIYFVTSTILPINKLIGRIYPVFGILLILMVVAVIGGLIVGGYALPEFTLENLHPNGQDIFPDMFITVACGAISGFHATQSPMASRCLKDEKDGRMVFYGAMVVESAIALMWALAGMAFYHDTVGLAQALDAGGASGVVYDIAMGVAGPLGGVLAVIGVIICPITSGDTALRAARLMVQDNTNKEESKMNNRILVTLVLMVPILILCSLDFSVLWNYFSWLNQTLACMILWTATVFIFRTTSRPKYALVTAIPAVFMTMVVTSFILCSDLGFGLDRTLSTAIAAVFTIIASLLFVRGYMKKSDATASC